MSATSNEPAALVPSPYFLDGPHGPLFCVHYSPPGAPTSSVLVIPPLAEELNKSRNLIALTAATLQAQGCSVLVPDLYGTGDSGGDFGECKWQHWVDDLKFAISWLDEQFPKRQCNLISVRAGALFLPELDKITNLGARKLILWQPLYAGEKFLRQFLRLRVMSNRFAGIEETVDELVSKLTSGETLEIAGYEFSAELATAIYKAELKVLSTNICSELVVLEFRPQLEGELSTESEAFLARMGDNCRSCTGKLVAAEQFWTTRDISASNSIADATAHELST